MQVILGANGVIGNHVAKTLLQHTGQIRLVSRNPKKVNPGDELFPADLNNADEVLKAVEDAKVVYLTAGLQHKTSVWQEQWPRIMANVINACKEHGTKCVFFDNVYAYGKVTGWMTEDTPMKPNSKKGEVRAKIADMLMNASAKGEINALIARSADFYGPNTPLSFTTVMVFENLAKGKAAQWMINPDFKHSLTYTPDAGKATAILGNTESAYNQVWHLPTASPPLTGQRFMDMAAAEFGVKSKSMVIRKWLLRLMAPFHPIVRENMEMLYQLEDDYLFDSTKFNKSFDIEPTPYSVGIAQTVRSYM